LQPKLSEIRANEAREKAAKAAQTSASAALSAVVTALDSSSAPRTGN
jgi:hypothetical protein